MNHYEMDSALQFDMFDWNLLTPAPRPTGLDFDGANGSVLLSPAGSLSLGDSLSPQYEMQQDSLWCDPADGLVGSPGADLLGEPQYLVDDIHSPDHKLLWSDDLISSYKLLPHSDLLHDSDLSALGPTAAPSPMDVKFEFGDVFDQSLALQSASYVDDCQKYDSIELSIVNAAISKPTFILGDFDEVMPLDSTVPESPMSGFYQPDNLLKENSSLIDLDTDENDSLNEAEIVCQLLREIDSLSDGGLHCSDSTLLHVSPEEVESVLSRDSSFENLAALDEPVSRPVQLPSLVTMPVMSIPITLGTGYQQAGLISKLAVSPAQITTQPYGTKDVLTERRQRKKEQNKTAALRYRQKKRDEKGHTNTEVEDLEQKNSELRARADELTREINYLKGLLDEIRQQ